MISEGPTPLLRKMPYTRRSYSRRSTSRGGRTRKSYRIRSAKRAANNGTDSASIYFRGTYRSTANWEDIRAGIVFNPLTAVCCDPNFRGYLGSF